MHLPPDHEEGSLNGCRSRDRSPPPAADPTCVSCITQPGRAPFGPATPADRGQEHNEKIWEGNSECPKEGLARLVARLCKVRRCFGIGGLLSGVPRASTGTASGLESPALQGKGAASAAAV